jgi:hypothetical protein
MAARAILNFLGCMMQSPHRWLSFGACLNITPQQVHSGSEMAVNSFTQSRQHKALSDRCDRRNRSLISVIVRYTRSVATPAEAGWKRRRQTRHLDGKIVSSKVCQMELSHIGTVFLALLFRCTPADSPGRLDAPLQLFIDPTLPVGFIHCNCSGRRGVQRAKERALGD